MIELALIVLCIWLFFKIAKGIFKLFFIVAIVVLAIALFQEFIGLDTVKQMFSIVDTLWVLV